MSDVLAFMEKYWLRVEQEGKRSRALELRMARWRKNNGKRFWEKVPVGLGWLSATLWVVGAARYLAVSG